MLFLNKKRPADCYKSGCKTCKIHDHHFHWKLWLMQNYELMLNSCSEQSSILDHSKSAEDKENLPDKPLIANTLGKLVKEIWKGDVERVRNGARGKQTVKFLHLAKENGCPILPNFVVL